MKGLGLWYRSDVVSCERQEVEHLEKMIPIGIESYKEMVDRDYYYVDKTLLIKEIADSGAKVNLFTRPRRFGKTLAMSMLRTFFEDERDEQGNKIDNRRYFNGKNIAACGEKYLSQQGKYPVISLTLKEAGKPSYEQAYDAMKDLITDEFRRHRYVLDREVLYEEERQEFQAISSKSANENDYARALFFLAHCLKKYHSSDVIILIDEYDVPLERAYFGGFYNEMVSFIRSLFGAALKTNDALQFAVLTGCLRISKESIFTGLNNLEVISILNPSFSEYFGFTEEEVQKILETYGQQGHQKEVKRWYDGYLFGETEVYNPWSIIRCVKDNYNKMEFVPQAYWANTSSNSIVREFIELADLNTREEIEQLMAGESIEKPVYEDITYGDLFRSQDNIWSFLFFTGYLKKTGEHFENRRLSLRLTVPNEEVLSIYENTISQWFEDKVKGLDRSALLHALEEGDCEAVGAFVSEQLQDSISYFDFAENYYHGFLVGLLHGLGRYKVRSNRESGNGRPDIIMQAASVRGKAFVFELKVSKEFCKMEEKCREALAQAAKKNYKAKLVQTGYSNITVYGVCFYQKECVVVRETAVP